MIYIYHMPQCSIYKITNTLNGKFYIGITSRKDPRRRFSEHVCHAKKEYNNGAFHRALRKYGKENFMMEVLETGLSSDQAKQREIELIAELCPPYNSTLGGDGRLGCSMSEEAKRHLSLVHKGKKWALGRKHSDETRQILREFGLSRIDLFNKYSHLGPKASSKMVKCLDTGEIFDSASAAARNFNIATSALIELCNKQRGRKTVGGLRFEYVSAS